MADTKISELTSAGALAGTEPVPIVQSGTTKKTTAQAIANLAPTGSSGLLAFKTYNPGTIATYTTTSDTSADVDATNLAVTFTVPASGQVLVRLTALGGVSSEAGQLYWQIRESTTVVSTDQMACTRTVNQLHSAPFIITGLTPSASKTYKWGFHRVAGVTGTMYAGGVAGPATMEVWAA